MSIVIGNQCRLAGAGLEVAICRNAPRPGHESSPAAFRSGAVSGSQRSASLRNSWARAALGFSSTVFRREMAFGLGEGAP
jgi:hypothetical protein